MLCYAACKRTEFACLGGVADCVAVKLHGRRARLFVCVTVLGQTLCVCVAVLGQTLCVCHCVGPNSLCVCVCVCVPLCWAKLFVCVCVTVLLSLLPDWHAATGQTSDTR